MASRLHRLAAIERPMLPQVLVEVKKVYKQDPYNIENLKNWLAYAKYTFLRPTDGNPVDRIKEYTSMLKDALVCRPNDHDPEAWSMIGEAYYSLYQYGRPSELRMKYCTETIACLRKALAQDPNHYESRVSLSLMKREWPSTVPPLSVEEDLWEREFVEEEVFEEDCRSRAFEEEIEDAVVENEKNPNNADNLRTWGTSLLELSYYKMDDERSDMITEGIGKLEKVLELNPEDIETKVELVAGKLRLRCPKIAEDKEYVRLLKEYRTLSEAARRI